MSFFALGAKDRIGKDHYLLKLKKMIDWSYLKKKLKGIHLNELNSKGGPKAYTNVSMFKVILLGQWHSLSDPGLEEALRVRLDFMMFTGFEIGNDVPDETTLCRFRNKLIERDLHLILFTEINRQLETHGIKVRKVEAALVDATLISSAARPRQTIEADGEVKKSVDPDANWLRKGKKCNYSKSGGEKSFLPNHLR